MQGVDCDSIHVPPVAWCTRKHPVVRSPQRSVLRLVEQLHPASARVRAGHDHSIARDGELNKTGSNQLHHDAHKPDAMSDHGGRHDVHTSGLAMDILEQARTWVKCARNALKGVSLMSDTRTV